MNSSFPEHLIDDELACMLVRYGLFNNERIISTDDRRFKCAPLYCSGATKAQMINYLICHGPNFLLNVELNSITIETWIRLLDEHDYHEEIIQNLPKNKRNEIYDGLFLHKSGNLPYKLFVDDKDGESSGGE
jgi:hypothetical protein